MAAALAGEQLEHRAVGVERGEEPRAHLVSAEQPDARGGVGVDDGHLLLGAREDDRRLKVLQDIPIRIRVRLKSCKTSRLGLGLG